MLLSLGSVQFGRGQHLLVVLDAEQAVLLHIRRQDDDDEKECRKREKAN